MQEMLGKDVTVAGVFSSSRCAGPGTCPGEAPGGRRGRHRAGGRSHRLIRGLQAHPRHVSRLVDITTLPHATRKCRSIAAAEIRCD